MNRKALPPVSVAPMMDRTDRHCRYFHRLLAPGILLYTEMVTTGALLHGARARFLRYSPQERPLALQLGGSDPAALAACAKMGEEEGYDEINLNCGCPSDRVQNGNFGACLMAEPALVADCVAAMAAAVTIPVTVKCRIAIDEHEEQPFLYDFLRTVSQAGCTQFIIHARKAWLRGLSPKENRDVPPLRYDIAAAAKRDFPQLKIVLNGGITTLAAVKEHLQTFDGVMIGREAYANPWLLAEIERDIIGNAVILSRAEAVRAMVPYIAQQAALYETPEKTITRHMTGLFHGCPGGRLWRRALSEREPLERALSHVLSREAA